MKTSELITIDDLKANALPELQGWKEKQDALVAENPFVTIIDNKTYDVAKKSRTALLKGRTEIQNQDKLIASKLKEFRSEVSETSKQLIEITLPSETKQQEEVKRYEVLKAEEKAKKEREEFQKTQKIKDSINSLFIEWKSAINQLNFNDLETFLMLDILADADTSKHEGFTMLFEETVANLTSLLEEKRKQLNIQEAQRIESKKLEDERKKFAEEKRIANEKQLKIDAENKIKQDKIDAENKRISEELTQKQLKIDAEKKRLEKIESDRIAKIEAEAETKKQAELLEKQKAENIAKQKAEDQRIKSLAPDKEKLKVFVDSLSFSKSIPVLKDEKLKTFLESTIEHIENQKELMFKKIESIK